MIQFFSFFPYKFEQTNVFANAQKRKVRPFEGMQRKAIVIVPSEEDFKARTEAQEKAECKDVPDNAVMEMKGIAKTFLSKSRYFFNIDDFNHNRAKFYDLIGRKHTHF